MDQQELNRRIQARGREFFATVQGETPSLFNREKWLGRVMELCMRNEDFKVRLFRFIDVFPTLTTNESLARHLAEYFESDEEVPRLLRWGTRAARHGGAVGTALLGRMIRVNIKEMARQFIVGEETAEAVNRLAGLRHEGFAFTVDLLGEATVTEEEAEGYLAANLAVLQALNAASAGWPPLPPASGGGESDWGHAPIINLSVKSTACTPRFRPENFDGMVAAVQERLERLYRPVITAGGFLCLDMETWQTRAVTLEVYRRLRTAFSDYPHLGIALQSYLRQTDQDLADLLAWARRHSLPVSVRLVKGAYWDFETARARQKSWPTPVYSQKAETDDAFERHARLILENHDICHLACGSHNIRSIAAVAEMAEALGVPAERYEFQVLYGMAEPVRRALLRSAGRVRLYAPFGEMVPGMAYLVRRLLENTANTSFLRQSFVEGEAPEGLLADPAAKISLRKELEPPGGPSRPEAGVLPPFANERAADFSREDERSAMRLALSEVRRRLGRVRPLLIGGREVLTGELRDSVNPAEPQQVVGRVCQAGEEEAAAALATARRAFPGWRATLREERAAVLLRAAAAARRRRPELAAWQVLEIGKQWEQADADVTEAIDFLEYYAREMLRLGAPRRIGVVAGEDNRLFYQPKGVAAVIAPWNFPLAISCGMAAAALVTGNTVLYKPSSLTPVVGWTLAELFREAGAPPGVFNYLPGPGGAVGDFLVSHPEISLIAFTGSMDVGLGIVELAAKTLPDQRRIKKVVAEMGGKNAIIIDDDADLDEAVPQVLQSAFAFQGQKCSACSRVIVLDAIYDAFVGRLVAAARALQVGPAEDPANDLGPVAEEAAQRRILEYIEMGRQEGRLLFTGAVPPGGGWYVPPVIIGSIRPEHRLAQEEVFGPVLAVMRAADFEEALAWANATRYALTGGVFSRSPARLEQARREFRVGNLYFNRPCTAALVGRQPFGGFKLSGTGTQAGGPDYLRHFMDPRVVTENTMRRGFAPEVGQ